MRLLTLLLILTTNLYAQEKFWAVEAGLGGTGLNLRANYHMDNKVSYGVFYNNVMAEDSDILGRKTDENSGHEIGLRYQIAIRELMKTGPVLIWDLGIYQYDLDVYSVTTGGLSASGKANGQLMNLIVRYNWFFNGWMLGLGAGYRFSNDEVESNPSNIDKDNIIIEEEIINLTFGFGF